MIIPNSTPIVGTVDLVLSLRSDRATCRCVPYSPESTRRMTTLIQDSLARTSQAEHNPPRPGPPRDGRPAADIPRPAQHCRLGEVPAPKSADRRRRSPAPIGPPSPPSVLVQPPNRKVSDRVTPKVTKSLRKGGQQNAPSRKFLLFLQLFPVGNCGKKRGWAAGW